jgi:hypothetical protein
MTSNFSNLSTNNGNTINVIFQNNVFNTNLGSGNLETSDFQVTLTGGSSTLNSPTPSSISKTSDTHYVLTLDLTGTSDGSELITVNPITNSIFDSSGNALSTDQSPNNTTYLKDNLAPTMAITSSTVSSGDISNDTSIALTFTSSESTTDFAQEDITISGGTLSAFSGSGTTYTATLTPSGDATYTIQVGGSTFTDASGNNNTASNVFSWIYDGTVPVLAFSLPTDNQGSVSINSKIILSFSENIYVNSGDIIIYKSIDDSIFETIDVTSAQVSGSGSNYITVSPGSAFALNTNYYINIDDGAFRDIGENNYAGISSKSALNFTTVANASTKSGTKIQRKVVNTTDDPNQHDAMDTYITNTSSAVISVGVDDSSNKYIIARGINLNDTPLLSIETNGSTILNGTFTSTAQSVSSDVRLKENIINLEPTMTNISKLRGVTYNWKEESGIQDERKQIGFIAQEVEEYYPELVNTDTTSGIKSVNYAQFSSILLEGLKEMHNKIKGLEDEITLLKKNKSDKRVYKKKN